MGSGKCRGRGQFSGIGRGGKRRIGVSHFKALKNQTILARLDGVALYLFSGDCTDRYWK